MNNNPQPHELRQQKLLRVAVEKIDDVQKQQLVVLFQRLLELREASMSPVRKMRAVLTDVQNRKAAVAILHHSFGQLKDLAWDDRTWATRLGLSVAITTTVATGGQSAGIAMLGTAIGVPLWVVFGAGGAFAGAMIEELKRSLPQPQGSGAEDSLLDEPLEAIPAAEFEVLTEELEAETTRLLAVVDDAIVSHEAGAEEECETTDQEDEARLVRVFLALRDRSEAVIQQLKRQ